MTKTPPFTPTFELRLVPQSREHTDANGNVFYQHNSYLEPGETVVDANSDVEMTVVKSYRNPLNRQELVTVQRNDGIGGPMEMPASAVRRLKLA